MKALISSSLMVLLLFSCGQSAEHGSANFRGQTENVNPAEAEPDYAEGFFEKGSEEELSEESLHGHQPDRQDSGSITLQGTNFAKTKWYECSDDVTGNYSGYNCSNRREIAQIFKNIFFQNVYSCVEQGLQKIGLRGASQIHIEHAGVTCDGNHNRKSLHCQLRAMDIKSINVNTADGKYAKISYSKLGNRSFYTALRECWGRTAVAQNECPVLGSYGRTASIGWEDRNHGHHMHLSLPVCSRGRLVGNYFVK